MNTLWPGRVVAAVLVALHVTAVLGYDPVFITSTPTNVTVVEGSQVTLECSVLKLATKKIIWRLKNRKAALSIGTDVFISDSRFSVKHDQGKNNWDLFIDGVWRGRDDGLYECQVPTDPPMRRYIQLNILPRPAKPVPTIEGLGGVDIGEEVHLICEVTSRDDQEPPEVTWFLDGNEVKPSGDGERKITVKVVGKRRVSHLYIKRASTKDAGTYICRASNRKTTYKILSVLNTGKSNTKREHDKHQQGSPRVGESNSSPQQLRPTHNKMVLSIVLSILAKNLRVLF